MQSSNFEEKTKYRTQLRSEQNNRKVHNIYAQQLPKKPQFPPSQKKQVSQFQSQIQNFKEDTRNSNIQRRQITQETLLQSGQLSRQSIENGISVGTPHMRNMQSPPMPVEELIHINDELQDSLVEKPSPKFYI